RRRSAFFSRVKCPCLLICEAGPLQGDTYGYFAWGCFSVFDFPLAFPYMRSFPRRGGALQRLFCLKPETHDPRRRLPCGPVNATLTVKTVDVHAPAMTYWQIGTGGGRPRVYWNFLKET